MKIEVNLPPEIVNVLRDKYGYRHVSWFVRDAVRRLLREYGLVK